MKEGWQLKSIGDVCEFQRGLTYTKGDEVDASDNIVLRATNIDLSSNLLSFDELKYISDKVVVPTSKIVKKGSLLICTASGSKSHLGKVAFIDDDYGYAFGGFMGMLTPLDGLLPKYLFHLMTSEGYKDFIGALSDGANINNLKFDDLMRFPVPVPPLPEQERIVALLDEAFAGLATAKANTERNLQNARAIFESHLQSLFSQRGVWGWIETTIGDQLTLQRGFDITKDQQNTGEIPVVSSGGIKSWHDEAMVQGPGVVIGRKGTLGKAFYLESDFWPHDTTLWVKDFKGNIPRFVYYLFVGLDVKQLDSGAANPALNRNQVHPIEVSWPEVSKQRDLIRVLDTLFDETQRLTRLYERKLAALEELKKSLLHQAFNGEL
jgi:type I restriction enzyme S subunit